MKSVCAKLFIIVFSLSLSTHLSAQSIKWENNLGGVMRDVPRSILPTASGGCIVLGEADSASNDVSNIYGLTDIWVTELDSSGNLIWEQNYGGSKGDYATSLKATPDGGYILVGSSQSTDHDVNNNYGAADIWVLKIGSNGNQQWEKNLGGSKVDGPGDVLVTSNGNYLIAAESLSDDNDVSANYGKTDAWIVMLDSNGNMLWENNFGGSEGESIKAVKQCPDGNFVLAGSSASSDHDVSGNNGQEDFWIIKIDASGNLIWEKNYGGSSDEEAQSIALTNDGGFMVAGYTFSDDMDVLSNHGSSDVWVLKLDSLGDLQSLTDAFNMGGSDIEFESSIMATGDGNFLVATTSESSDIDVSNNYGNEDIWLAKINSLGLILWEQNYGGSDIEYFDDAALNNNGNIFITGRSGSDDQDVSDNYGSYDIWVARIEGSNNINIPKAIEKPNLPSLSPNPVQSQLRLNFQENIAGNLVFKLYNLQGQLVLKKQLSQGRSNFTLDLAGLPNGIHVAQIEGGKALQKRKILIEH